MVALLSKMYLDNKKIYLFILYFLFILNEKIDLNNVVFLLLQTMSKQRLGQFYTTNYDYILSNMKIPENTKHIIEPFVGNGDLLNFITNRKIMI